MSPRKNAGRVNLEKLETTLPSKYTKVIYAQAMCMLEHGEGERKVRVPHKTNALTYDMF